MAAAKLFLKVGYDRATVRDIAKKVGLQSGSIFYHFKTKEDILVDVMSEGLRQFAEAVNQPLRDASSPLEKLRGLFLGHLKALLNPDNSEIAVVLSEWRQLSPQSRRLVVKLRDDVDDVWNEVLREAAAQGLVQGDLRILRLSMLGAINWSLQWYDRRGKLTIEELASRLLETFVPPDRIPK
ncbi:MAG: TetR/AcrR family transcriptional regulator [Roseiarcus sp.]